MKSPWGVRHLKLWCLLSAALAVVNCRCREEKELNCTAKFCSRNYKYYCLKCFDIGNHTCNFTWETKPERNNFTTDVTKGTCEVNSFPVFSFSAGFEIIYIDHGERNWTCSRRLYISRKPYLLSKTLTIAKVPKKGAQKMCGTDKPIGVQVHVNLTRDTLEDNGQPSDVMITQTGVEGVAADLTGKPVVDSKPKVVTYNYTLDPKKLDTGRHTLGCKFNLFGEQSECDNLTVDVYAPPKLVIDHNGDVQTEPLCVTSRDTVNITCEFSLPWTQHHVTITIGNITKTGERMITAEPLMLGASPVVVYCEVDDDDGCRLSTERRTIKVVANTRDCTNRGGVTTDSGTAEDDGDNMEKYYIIAGGIVLVVLIISGAVYLWYRRKRKNPKKQPKRADPKNPIPDDASDSVASSDNTQSKWSKIIDLASSEDTESNDSLSTSNETGSTETGSIISGSTVSGSTETGSTYSGSVKSGDTRSTRSSWMRKLSFMA